MRKQLKHLLDLWNERMSVLRNSDADDKALARNHIERCIADLKEVLDNDKLCNCKKEKKRKLKSCKHGKNFMEAYLSGKVPLEKIHDYIDKWHETDTGLRPMYEALGLTDKEYELFVTSYERFELYMENVFNKSKQSKRKKLVDNTVSKVLATLVLQDKEKIVKCETCRDLGYVYAYQDNNIPCPDCKINNKKEQMKCKTCK